MNAPSGPAAPASGFDDIPDIPDFADLAADPEIAPLLEFEPVVRKVKRPDGWTPELQRELIARIAATGTLQKAVWQMNKHATGAEALYIVPSADEFRASWDAAIAIGRRRNGLDCGPPFAGEVPGITRRRKSPSLPGEGWEENPEISEDQKWDLIHNIGVKFMRKVAAERQARLAGEIVAADFYLRQITMLEVVFDLTCGEFGWDAQEVLRQLRRGGTPVWGIVSTPLADWLDRSRRLWWAQEGEPERPPHPDVRFLQRHRSDEGDYCTATDQNTYGAHTPPARGYSEEQWAAMPFDEQVAARERQKAEDAEEQLAWEARARADWEERDAQS